MQRYVFQEHFMPTMNHVKMVRLLVKYLHYFANSATLVVSSPYTHNIQSPLDQFKRYFFLEFVISLCKVANNSTPYILESVLVECKKKNMG